MELGFLCSTWTSSISLSVAASSSTSKAAMLSLSCCMLVAPIITEPMYHRDLAQARASCVGDRPLRLEMAAYSATATCHMQAWSGWLVQWLVQADDELKYEWSSYDT